MKKPLKKALSMALVCSFLLSSALSAQAAGRGSSRYGQNSYWDWSWDWNMGWDWDWGDLWGTGSSEEEPAPETETTPEDAATPENTVLPEDTAEPEEETETEEEEPVFVTGNETPVQSGSEDAPGLMLALVEDQSTVSENVVMRAAVYEAGDAEAQAELGDSNVVYYPSTFIDYDQDDIAQEMANLDVKYAVDNNNSTSSNSWTWKGMYFGFGRLDDTSPTGTYNPGGESYTSINVQYSTVYENRNSTAYYYLANDGKYYRISISRSDNSGNRRYTITYTDANGDTQTPVDNKSNASIILYTLSSNGGTSVTSSNFAEWMYWGEDNNGAGPSYIHSGIVTGLVDGIPQFAASYASQLFDATELDGKTRYTNVGLPFIYNEETGYYTFDSASNGAYFPNGQAASDTNLTLLDAPVAIYNGTEDEDRTNLGWYTGFMPFNKPDTETATTEDYRKYDDNEDQIEGPVYPLTLDGGGKNYYFSTITSVPFTMTENGRIIGSDDTSAPIVFDFTGDDDVWVFIDDVLILDLGGIHDAVTGKINFATNEVTFSATGSNKTTGDATGTYGTAENAGEVSQGAIFNDGDTVGKLNTTRSTFAATDNHTLTVVYMERGDGLSNNKIKFNLPQKDYIAVTKQIDQNLYKNTNENEVVEPITDELFTTLNTRDFTYILYEDDTAMTGVRFSRYDANGNFTGNGTTASDGTFNVKNGETVRFYDISFDGKTSYYVAELDPDAGSTNNAWGTAAWAHTINTAYSDKATVTDTANRDDYYVSDTITTQGSEEAVDVITFTNTNKLLSPVADIANDEYVLDFGLAVELNPLANDTYSATTDSLKLTGIDKTETGDFFDKITGEYGTLEIKNNRAVYTLNKQLTGVEEFYYRVGLTYGEDNLEGKTGKITIMPATTMYYEESFAGLNFTTNVEWTDKGEAQGGYQEEGRVGNTSDSPYGSDVIYKNNTGDSYGTSKYVNTDEGAAKFSYTFTGTGTALYARTSDKSAYLIITVKDKNGTVVSDEWRRNTIYKPVEDTQLTNNTLYNIPVYVFEADEHGTYTVNVTVNKAMIVNGSYYRGCDFYLDGIRVYDPMGAYESESNVLTTVQDAYGRDGEAYITVETLRNKLLLDSTKYEQVMEPKMEAATDANGNPVLDEEGNPVYEPVVDENNELVYEPVVDENGDPVYQIAWDDENFVLFTDVDGTIEDAQTYQSAGPKEEVYMKAGQSVTFSLANWNQNRNMIYLGIKAPAGEGSVSINGKSIAINNTTDIYYNITDYAEVSNNVATFEVKADSALISVTTIKVTGTAEFTIVSGSPKYPEEADYTPDDQNPEDEALTLGSDEAEEPTSEAPDDAEFIIIEEESVEIEDNNVVYVEIIEEPIENEIIIVDSPDEP